MVICCNKASVPDLLFILDATRASSSCPHVVDRLLHASQLPQGHPRAWVAPIQRTSPGCPTFTNVLQTACCQVITHLCSTSTTRRLVYNHVLPGTPPQRATHTRTCRGGSITGGRQRQFRQRCHLSIELAPPPTPPSM